MSTGTAKILYVKNELLTANSKQIHKHQQFQLQGKQNTTLIEIPLNQASWSLCRADTKISSCLGHASYMRRKGISNCYEFRFSSILYFNFPIKWVSVKQVSTVLKIFWRSLHEMDTSLLDLVPNGSIILSDSTKNNNDS